MAQRLATEYVKTCLELTEAEMCRFVQMFEEQGSQIHVKVVGNGSQEIELRDEAGEEIVLSFTRKADKYVCQGSCRLSSSKLAGAMRKAVSHFKGDAIVNRIYCGFSMLYQYERGTVVRIVENKNGRQKVVYEYKDTLGELENLFKRTEVENEIGRVQRNIDVLLDTRNRTADINALAGIDRDLQQMTKRMFTLEG